MKASKENPTDEVISEGEANQTVIVKCLIIKCNLPLSLVENGAFREFMNECNVRWSPISSKKLKQDPIATFKEKVNKFIHEASDPVGHVTLTLTHPQDSYRD